MSVFYDSPLACIVIRMTSFKFKLKLNVSAGSIAVVTVAVVGLVSAAGYLWLDYGLRPRSARPHFLVLYVPPGYRASQIGNLLEQKRLIRSRRAFVLWTKVTRKESKLWAGYYNISTHFSGQFIVKILTEHTPYSRLVRVTIPEGYSLRQIAETLGNKKLVDSDEFIDYVHNSAKMELLPQFPWMAMVPTRNLEGVLYPDTYLFPPSASKRLIVKTMLTAFSRQVLPVWNASSPNATLNFYNTLIMASIVEKEAIVSEEMPVIAGVFFNRLDRNMPLASDPTVIYALGLNWKDTVFYRDLKVESPYNTYRNRGLPPTPIASPGIVSFKAALQPIRGDYFFFVASPEDNGRHIFTRNYKEHLLAQKKSPSTSN